VAKQVTFHAGLPKTGSTTLQFYLRERPLELKSAGALYPGKEEHATFDKHHHPLIIHSMIGEIKGPSLAPSMKNCRGAVEETFEMFRDSEYQNLIWSHEGLVLASGSWDVDYIQWLLGGETARFVIFMRYMDEWIESRTKQMIWARAGHARHRIKSKLRPVAAPASPVARRRRSPARPPRSMMDQGARVIAAMRNLRSQFPQAEIEVRSFDVSRARGTLIADALQALGLPNSGGFANADGDARLRNDTKSTAYSMLLYRLEAVQADIDVIHEIARAAARRDKRLIKYEPLMGRRFRFLAEAEITQARADYEILREDYPELPTQPPLAAGQDDGWLTNPEAMALVEWFRPDISDDACASACAALAEG